MLAFDDHYETVREGKHDDEVRADTYAEALEVLVLRYGIRRVWTIVEPDDGQHDEDPERFTFYALPGLHVVNALYYVVSTEPVRAEHADQDFIY